ncbi:MAG: ABC transporter substrate-binding protein [Planctomycetota bacterium]
MTRFQLTAAAAALLLVGCPAPDGAGSGGSGPVGTPGLKTLVFGRGQESVTLDPANATDGESVKVIVNVFDTLVRYAEGSTQVEPSLAEKWDVSEDRLTWTFTLREGATFHDGSPVDAEAVVFSMERQRDPEHPFHQGEFVYWNDQFGAVRSVEASDPRTVVFQLSEPFVPFLQNLAMFSASIVCPSEFTRLQEAGTKDVGAAFAIAPVGSGPFKFKEWRPSEALILEAFDAYWGGRPKLDEVIFRAIGDNNSRLQLLKKGELHGMDGINPADVQGLEQEDSIELHLLKPGSNTAYLAFNNLKEPFTDPRVRRACAMALNLEKVASSLYYGLAVPAKNLLPPTIRGYNDALPAREQDKEGAKKLLAEAGFPDGFESTVWVFTNPRPYMPQPSKTAQYVKNALAQIGVKVEVVTKEWASYLEEVEKAEHDMAFMGWSSDNGDPDNFLYVLLSKHSTKEGSASNISFYRSDMVTTLLEDARKEFDPAQRDALYQKAQAQIYEDVPMVPLVHNVFVVAMRKEVKGFTMHPLNELRFHKVDLE